MLYDAQARQLVAPGTALDDALNVIQRGAQSSAASAVNKLAVRLGAGNDRLAELVRREQLRGELPRQHDLTLRAVDSVRYAELVQTMDIAHGADFVNVQVSSPRD